MKNSSATSKLIFSLLLLSIASCMVMRVAEARGPIVSRHCSTVADCGLWCYGCSNCACKDTYCTCVSDAATQLGLHPPATTNVDSSATINPDVELCFVHCPKGCHCYGRQCLCGETRQ
ncbi:hypothetical protein LINPERPRIM_LOCUS28207 [Linum perenne]